MSLDWASQVTQKIRKLPTVWRTWVCSLSGEDELEQEMAAHSSLLARRIP